MRFWTLISFATLLVAPMKVFAEVRYGVNDLGDLGQHFAEPYRVNASGYVVGESFTAQERQHAFLWSGLDGMTDLTALAANSGSFGGYAGSSYGLNDHNQVVGYAYSSSTDVGRAFLATPSTG